MTRRWCAAWIGVVMVSLWPSLVMAQEDVEQRIEALVAAMSLEEKIGQMSLRGRSSRSKDDPRKLEAEVREGRLGAMLNVMDRAAVDRLQEVAVNESRHGIPLLFGRDVIHGFRTIFPIPLGLAASFDRELAAEAMRISAREASTYGIRWTFAPMVDITRDPRWGRIAESPGEDPYLAEEMAIAMIHGFQGEDLSAPDSLAACIKHFAAYGAAVGGRDYASAQVPGALMHNVYLRPFDAGIRAGAATVMTAFNEIDGIPASGHEPLLRDLLRDTWGFDGLVVSDWESVTEMIAHGFSADAKDAARQAATAGVDLEMTSRSFLDHLPELVAEGHVDLAVIDDAVRNILRVKMRLGLFENPQRDASRGDEQLLTEPALAAARRAAQVSTVLLTNSGVLPLSPEIGRVAVIGPLAEAPHEQLGTWTFDGKAENSQTPLAALRQRLGDERVAFAAGLSHSRSRDREGFEAALDAARGADVVLFFGGEEAILSGEAHSRADLRLPGAQEALLSELAELGKPIVLTVLSGRPNTLEDVIDRVDAVLMAWHPGTMGGPALADLLFGDVSPSGRLPVTWPRTVGQVPIYYNHKRTGRPAPAKTLSFDEIPVGAWQSSLSNTSRYLDYGTQPAFPFGHGLTYTTFHYQDLRVTPATVTPDGTVTITARVANTGTRRATEVVQLYARDPVASLTRPVRELKGFERIELGPGETRQVTFELPASAMSFFHADGSKHLEAGEIQVWIGWNASAGLEGKFEITKGDAGSSP
ncbi:MAG: glycoside hydrolase family 3 N-terminal domain-containing protein [Acidobacteriota bacterium]